MILYIGAVNISGGRADNALCLSTDNVWFTVDDPRLVTETF